MAGRERSLGIRLGPAGTTGARVGPDRLGAQYVRANLDPSDRYVQSLPGSGRHRLAPGGTGLDNLVVAGDWTACGFDAGSMEAATRSGVLAARAVLSGSKGCLPADGDQVTGRRMAPGERDTSSARSSVSGCLRPRWWTDTSRSSIASRWRPASTCPRGAPRDTQASVGGAARMLEAGLQALDGAARLMSDAVAPSTETLVLPPTEPGLDSEASVWIHNRTSSLVASVELHATILISAEESSIPGDAVTFLPEGVVRVEPGTCREVTVRVSVPEGQPVGLYHGLLVGSGAPDGAITLLSRWRAGERVVVTDPGSGFLEQLDDYDRIARRAALSYLRGSGVSSYVGVPAADYLQRAGKGLRPALCLATCTAFGGDVEDALPSAAAIELFHTAFLVHDDVEDDSELRRGAPTLHRRYGRALAMNTGDGLAVLALGHCGTTSTGWGAGLPRRSGRSST